MFDIDLDSEGDDSLPFLLKENRISKAEAIRLAEQNYERVEALLAKEVERDATCSSVWEVD